MRQGAGRPQPPDSGKATIFMAKAKFFRRKPAAKNEKNVLINGKMQFSLSTEIKCPKSGIFANNYWVG